MSTFSFTATVWQSKNGKWFGVTLPFDVADDVDDAASVRGGFGSVRVEVTIGGSTWQTSLFPSKSDASFVLIIKKAVRSAEGLGVGTQTRVDLVVV